MGVSIFGAGWLILGAALVVAAVLVRRGAGSSRGMRVVARLALEPRRSLIVVELDGRVLALASSEAGISVVAELDPSSATRLAGEPTSALSALLPRRS